MPFRTYLPNGISSLSYVEITFGVTPDNSTLEYIIMAQPDGAGGYLLKLFNNAGTVDTFSLNPSGTTVTLPTPITLGSLSISAYRLALAGNEFQLDLTLTRTGAFSDQIHILAVSGANYSSPWNQMNGLWSSTNAPTAPVATLSTPTLNFGSDFVNNLSSATQTLTITNTGNAPLIFAASNPFTFSGADASDFSQTSNCPASLEASAYCTVSLEFDPASAGSRSATLSIADNAGNSPQTVTLQGVAEAAPTTFTTYLGTYGSGFQTYSGSSSVVIPFRTFIPAGISQLAYMGMDLVANGGNFEYFITALPDGSGGFNLGISGSSISADMQPTGVTQTLATPITYGNLSITAYRLEYQGNEVQLDLTLNRTGTFTDQIVILATTPNNATYSAPWNTNNGQWSNQ